MIEGAGTLAAINYAGAQVVEADAGILQGPNADIAKGKVNPAGRPERAPEESNSEPNASSQRQADAREEQGRLLDVLG